MIAQSRTGTAGAVPRRRIVIEVKRMSYDMLRTELQDVARDEGLTPAKLESTRLLALVAEIPDWSVVDATKVLYRLIVDVVAGLRGEKARTAARATLNLEGSPVEGRSAMGRQAALAAKRHVHPDTVRGWWRNAVKSLADLLPSRIDELNRDPSRWNAYLTESSAEDVDRPDYSFDRVEVAWRLRGKRGIDMTTSRWLVARRDGVDRVLARGWYFSDRRPGSCEVLPLMNCQQISSTNVGRGILVSELALPRPLKQGEGVFYAYQVVIHSERETEKLFYHSVSSAGVKLLLYRVQFDPDVQPARIWSFASPDEVDAAIPPPLGSPRYLTTNRFGYTECSFRDCRHGIKYGVSWQWHEGV
jgi:hypothetical protein